MKTQIKMLIAAVALVPAAGMAGDVDPNDIRAYLNQSIEVSSPDDVNRDIESQPTAAGRPDIRVDSSTQWARDGYFENIPSNGDL